MSAPELALKHATLLALGAEVDVLVMRNEVGRGFKQRLFDELCRDCQRSANRFRIQYGLGVGSPDLIAVVRGHFLGLELKSDRGTLSDEQLRWHAAAEARGVQVATVRSVEDAVRAVEGARQ